LLSPKVHRVEIVWQGPDALASELAAGFTGEHSRSSEGLMFVAREPQLVDRFVAAVLAGGGSLTQVTPQRETLEELFVRDAGSDPQEQHSG
jgi:ABC-2 type transport system ATP-binding protein